MALVTISSLPLASKVANTDILLVEQEEGTKKVKIGTVLDLVRNLELDFDMSTINNLLNAKADNVDAQRTTSDKSVTGAINELNNSIKSLNTTITSLTNTVNNAIVISSSQPSNNNTKIWVDTSNNIIKYKLNSEWKALGAVYN